MSRSNLTLRGRLSPADALAWAIDSFVARCEARNLSPHTLRFYRIRLSAFFRHLKREEWIAVSFSSRYTRGRSSSRLLGAHPFLEFFESVNA